MLTNALSVLPFVGVFIFLWWRISRGRLDMWFCSAVIVFVAGAIFGLWWQNYRARHMKCPQCKSDLVRTERVAPGQPINFVCSRCDVVWVTGLSEADD